MQVFRYDLSMQYRVVELDRDLAETAATLIMRHPLRAYDAIQLASALHIENELKRVHAPSLIFLVADERLANVAQTEKLQTDNPNHH